MQKLSGLNKASVLRADFVDNDGAVIEPGGGVIASLDISVTGLFDAFAAAAAAEKKLRGWAAASRCKPTYYD